MYILRQLLDPLDDRGLPHLQDENPANINYTTDCIIGLQKSYIKYFALRILCTHTQVSDLITGEAITPIPVVQEKYIYTWGDDGLPLSQGKEIRFYHKDGSIDTKPNKVLPGKSLESGDREKIVVARRNDIIDYLKARSKELGLMSEDGTNLVESFFDSYFQSSEKYIKSGNPNLIELVKSSELSWLNIDVSAVTPFATLRQAIIYNLQKTLEIPSQEEINQFLTNA